MSTQPRIGLVLSAGGLRGAAHLGVLRRLATAGIHLDSIVGVSAGAVIAAYYAAVGLTIDDLIADAKVFRGRHIVAHSLNLRSWQWFRWIFDPFAGIIPRRLRQLQSAQFDELHHGMRAIGVVCHDLTHNCPRYLASGAHDTVSLYDAVATSASVPSMFPPRPIVFKGQQCEFTDGGLSDALPIEFARSQAIGATHVIVSDCRSRGERPKNTEHPNCVYVRPNLKGTAVLRAPRASLLLTVEAGEAALTTSAIAQIRKWGPKASEIRQAPV